MAPDRTGSPLLPPRPGRAGIPRELPAAFVRVESAPAELPPGAAVLAEGLYALFPAPGDPAVVDAAVRLARQQIVAGNGQKPAALVFAGAVRSGATGYLPVADPLLEALARHPPVLAAGGVFLTARAAQSLEEGYRLVAVPDYVDDGGKRFPLFALGAARTAPVPFRNAEVLHRRLAWVPRPESEELRLTFAEAPVIRLTGPLGVGKSRLAWESLRGSKARILWSATGSRRGEAPGHR
ncbi:MAG TPA: hypothetical protein PKX99_09910, partial [Thermoanaerobaculia bacterium]|nr:hypothetical protein [Thermoanaerobaculia bacterium]